MKEELQGKLVEILTSIQTAAGKASDFAMAELPDIAQSYVAYGRFVETGQAVMCVLLLASGVLAVLAAFRSKEVESYGSWVPWRIFAGVFGGVASVFGFVGTLIEGAQAALVWFAPKVWLLKEIASLLK